MSRNKGPRLTWRGSSRAQGEHAAAMREMAQRKRERDTAEVETKRAARAKRFPVVKCYSDYLQTKYWKSRRSRRIAVANHRCEVCSSPGPLQVHHLNYKRLWRERNRDLQVLCVGCHASTHEHDKGTAGPLTMEFMAIMEDDSK